MLKQPPGRFLLSCLVILSSLAATAVAFRDHFTVGVQPDGRFVVPNGQLLTPAGAHIEVNDRPLGMVRQPQRHALLAVVTGSNFNPRALHLIDLDSQTLKQTISIGEQLRRRRLQSGRRQDLRRRRRQQRREVLHPRPRTACLPPPARFRSPAARSRAACR